MEAVGIGDLHLSAVNGSGGLSRYVSGNSDKAILKEVQAAVDYAREHYIKNAFIYGDFCDGPKMSYQAHLALYEFFTRNKDIMFYGILGNHDKLAKGKQYGSSCDLLEKFSLSNFKLYSEPTVEKIDGVLVNFLSFPYHNWNPDCLNICHIDVHGSVMDSGRPSQSRVKLDKNAVVVAGHIHTKGKVGKKCFYSGTMYQTNFGEKQEKGFHHIMFNSPDDFEIQFIPHTPSILLHTVTVYSEKDLQGLPTSPNNIYRLLIQDGADIVPEQYAHLNTAVIKSFASKKDLQEALTSQLEYVSIEDIKPEQVFEELLDNREDITDIMKERIRQARYRVLKSL